MNDYFEIFSDVLLLATFQPRSRDRLDQAGRQGSDQRGRAAPASLDRRFNQPQRG